MQCISRFIYYKTVWVLNLDTMQETKASWSALRDYVKLGGVVLGASYIDEEFRVEQYQFDTSLDVVRSILVNKIRYQILNDKLVYLDSPEQRVCISKYSNRVGSGSIVPHNKCWSVFDSNIIEIEPDPFRYARPTPYMDIHGVSDEVALSVYKESLTKDYVIRDNNVRQESLRCVAAVMNKVFWTGQISASYQDFAFLSLKSLLLADFPSEESRTRVRLATYKRYSDIWDWRAFCKSMRRGQFLNSLRDRQSLISSSEYDTLVRSIIYINCSGNSREVIEKLDWFFS